jgi:hypothetical protein
VVGRDVGSLDGSLIGVAVGNLLGGTIGRLVGVDVGNPLGDELGPRGGRSDGHDGLDCRSRSFLVATDPISENESEPVRLSVQTSV